MEADIVEAIAIVFFAGLIVDGLAEANRNRRKKRAWWRHG